MIPSPDRDWKTLRYNSRISIRDQFCRNYKATPHKPSRAVAVQTTVVRAEVATNALQYYWLDHGRPNFSAAPNSEVRELEGVAGRDESACSERQAGCL